MKDDLTRAIEDGLRGSRALNAAMAFGVPVEAYGECRKSVAVALAPLIEARVREARADELVRLVTRAKSWMSAQDLCALAIQRAEEVRRA